MYGYHTLAETAGLLEDAIRENEDVEVIHELVKEFTECAEFIARHS
jgi:hypothetical protein